jgi:hypothetical protein
MEDYGVSLKKLLADDGIYSAQGYRLYILQSYVLPDDTGTVLYNAVWRPGLFAYNPGYGLTTAEAETEYATVFPMNERLYLFQGYVQDLCCVFYNAAYRPGTSLEVAAHSMTAKDFKAKSNSLYLAGWRLYLMQSYVLGGEVYYDALWRPGDHDNIVLQGVTYAEYIAEFNERQSRGWRLYILDTYVIGSTVYYNAVWRMGTYDRPL